MRLIFMFSNFFNYFNYVLYHTYTTEYAIIDKKKYTFEQLKNGIKKL